MEQYGLNLGIAFQIIDDVLDYTGSELIIGKPAGNDLRQGLVTLPLIYALRNEQNGRAEMVEQIVQFGASDTDAIDNFVKWVASSPAIAEAFDLARHYAARARALLSEFPASPERAVLEELVDFVVARSR
jgi:geranylgeranyl pyrophosphate synthase